MKREVNLVALLAIIFTVSVWGLSFISTKVLLNYMPPVEIAFFRFMLAAFFMLGIIIYKRPEKIARKDFLRLISGGAIGIPLYFLFENTGLTFTTAGMASLIIATIPVLNILIGAVFFKEKTSFKGIMGALISFLGVYAIISFGIDGDGSGVNSLKGNSLIFMAALSWVFYNRVNAPLLEKYESKTINIYQIFIGTFMLAMLVLPQGISLEAFTLVVGLNLVFLGVFCSAIAYIFYLYALHNLGTIAVTTFINLIPVFGVLGGVLILGEIILLGQILGGVMVVAGVMLVTIPTKGER